MAARVNTKFVLLLSLVLIVLVGGAAGAYLFVFKQSPEELNQEGEGFIQQAVAKAKLVDEISADEQLSDDERKAKAQEAFLQSGQDYRLAAEKFGLAFNQDRTNVDLLLKYVDASKMVHVNSQEKALDQMERIVGSLGLATQLTDREDVLEAFYEQNLDMHSWGMTRLALSNISTHVDEKLEIDPSNRIALKFRGIASTLRLNPEQSNFDDYQEAKESLEEAIRQLPEDAELRMYLAMWHVAEARRVLKGEPEKAADHIEQAKQMSEEALAMSPEDTDVQFLRIQVLLADPVYRSTDDVISEEEKEAIRATNKAIYAEVQHIVDALEAQLLENPRPMKDVTRLVDIMGRLGREIVKVENGLGQTTTGLQRGEQLLRVAIAAEPLNIVYRAHLGGMLKIQMNLDAALEAFRQADSIEGVGPYDMILRQMSAKTAARREIANIELIKAEAEQDPQTKEEKLKIAEDAIEHLDQIMPNKADVEMLRGKVALLRGSNSKALQHLDRSVELYQQAGQSSIEAMLLSARARQNEQQWGVAADRLETLARLPGVANSPESAARIRTQLAEIYINANELDRAAFQIKALREGLTAARDGVPEDQPALAPDAVSTKMLAAGLDLKLGNIESALVLYRDIDALCNRQVVANIARAYTRRGDLDSARQTLLDYLDTDPGNGAVLNQYAALLRGTAEERQAALEPVLAKAEQAGMPADAVEALRVGSLPMNMVAEEDRDEMVEKLVRAGAQDELGRELLRVGFWQRMNEPDKARVAFDRAEALDPDHPQVIMLGITFALEDEDQARVDQLATKAAEKNVDLADGLFVRGRIAAARKDLGQAITYYNQGLEKRPVYDEGWKILGDLYARRGNADEAVAAYRRAIEQKPNNVGAMIGMAQAHLTRNRTDDAVHAMRDAVRINDSNPALIQRYLAVETQHGSIEEAVRVLRQIVDRNPQSVENRLALASLLSRAGQTQEALAEVDRYEAVNGGSLRTVGLRASIAQNAGNLEQARQIFEGYIESLGDDASLQDRMAAAQFYRQIQQPERAIAAYERAMPMDDDPARPVLRALADYFFTLGRFADAATHYDTLIASAVKDDEDRETLMRRQTETLLRVGDLDRAEALLASQPDEAMVLMLRSMVQQQRGNRDQALALLDQAVRADAEFAQAYMQRGLLKLADSPEAALADAEKALEIDGTLTPARRLKAQVLLIQERTDEAIDELNSVLAADPNDAVSRIALARIYLGNDDLDAARDLIAAGEKNDPGNPMWSQLSAQVALRGGSPAERIDRLEALVVENPKAVTVQALAEAYLAADRPQDAVGVFDRFPQLTNANIPLQARRGQALVQAGNLQGGGRVLGLAMQRSTNRNQLMFVARVTETAVGPERAVELLDAAGKSQPDKRLAYGMAKSLVLLSNDMFAQALDFLPQLEEMAESVDPAALQDIRRMRAISHYQTGQFEEARYAYEQIIDANPEDVEALNNLAFLLANDLDEPKTALPLAQKAVELTQPPQASVLDTLGLVQLASGDAENARKTLEKAIELQPLPAIHLHLGRAYKDLGMPDEARQSLQAALDRARDTNDTDTAEKARRLLESL